MNKFHSIEDVIATIKTASTRIIPIVMPARLDNEYRDIVALIHSNKGIESFP